MSTTNVMESCSVSLSRKEQRIQLQEQSGVPMCVSWRYGSHWYHDSHLLLEFISTTPPPSLAISTAASVQSSHHRPQVQHVWTCSYIRRSSSQQVCLFIKQVTRLSLTHTHGDFLLFVLSWDTRPPFSTSVPIRGCLLPSKIQSICEEITNHVGLVSFQKFKINRMVLNMKVRRDKYNFSQLQRAFLTLMHHM